MSRLPEHVYVVQEGGAHDGFGLDLSWDHVKYSVNVKQDGFWKYVPFFGPHQTRELLHGVSGIVRSGELMAIMGPSGSGKTTLLDCLSHRKEGGRQSGEVIIDGAPFSKGDFQKVASYVVQSDHMFPDLTVKETLLYAARLKLPISLHGEFAKNRVRQIIHTLRLEKVAESKVGGELIRGISGGERKRVSIGIELVTDPQIIFLDEPTTGLDGSSAYMVVKSLKRLAAEGKTVVLTIHQPTAKTFKLFDRLTVLHKGETVYTGPAREVVPFYEETLGASISAWENPADWILEAISPDAADKEVAVNCASLLKEAFHEKSEAFAPVETMAPRRGGHLNLPRVRTPGMFMRYVLLTHRGYKRIIRNPALFWVRYLTQVFLALLVGSVYWQLDNNQTSIQNRNALLFYAIMNITLSCVPLVVIFISERVVFLRERASGSYGVIPYFAAASTVQIPALIAISLTYSVALFFMVGLQLKSGLGFLYFWIVVLIMMIVGDSISFAISAFASSVEIANACLSFVMGLALMFGGFFESNKSIPVWFIWAKFTSFFNFGYRAVVLSEYEGLHLHCDHVNNSICPITRGEQVISQLGLDDPSALHHFWVNIAILVGFAFFARILTLLLLWKVKPGVST